MFVIQTPLDDGNIIGVYESLEEAKVIADKITLEKNEFVIVAEFKLNKLDMRCCLDKVVYETTIVTKRLPNGLEVYKNNY
jgi:hypothetical protein